MRSLFIIIVISFFVSTNSYSQPIQLSDSAQVSLLTNYPWNKEIYALFGHTAIRVQDPVHDIDYAFNYGIFDFSSSNFTYRFSKGETDYMVFPFPFIKYIEEYDDRQVITVEQILNLNQVEKQSIWDALVINSLPENRVYRYNYFFDNCSTRPRDIVEQNISGTIIYPSTGKQQTFRDLIREYTSLSPWSEFGIDMVIGSGAERVATDREKMFLPLYLENAYDGAVIKDKDGSERKLVAYDQLLTDYPLNKKASGIFTPLVTGCILFALSLVISYFTLRRRFLLGGKIFDTVLFVVAGMAGIIIAFLTLFSEHPYVDSNWNIIWLNPLQLIAATLFFVKSLSKYVYCYHFINFALLSLFLLFWGLIPQQLEIAFIPFILSLWIRSGTNFVEYKSMKQRN